MGSGHCFFGEVNRRQDDGLPLHQHHPPSIAHLCLLNGDLFLSETICNENLVPQVVLALFGRSLGVRRLYVRVLLAIFQVCWISNGVIDSESVLRCDHDLSFM